MACVRASDISPSRSSLEIASLIQLVEFLCQVLPEDIGWAAAADRLVPSRPACLGIQAKNRCLRGGAREACGLAGRRFGGGRRLKAACPNQLSQRMLIQNRDEGLEGLPKHAIDGGGALDSARGRLAAGAFGRDVGAFGDPDDIADADFFRGQGGLEASEVFRKPPRTRMGTIFATLYSVIAVQLRNVARTDMAIPCQRTNASES